MHITVIIPTYNGREYVGSTLDSVLGQSISNIDIIVVDDGSTDGTPEVIAERFGDRNFTMVSQKNAGVGAARQYGLSFARPDTDYVLFIDQDDELLPNAIETLSSYLEEHPNCAICFGQAVAIDGKGEVMNSGRIHRPTREHYAHNFLEWKPNTGAVTPVDICSSSCMATPGQALIRATALRAIGGFKNNCSPSDDVNLWMEASLRYEVWGLDVVTMRYRIHDQNTSKKTWKMRKAGFRLRLHWLRIAPWRIKFEVVRAYVIRIWDRGIVRNFASRTDPGR